jgi:hypothetical protein
MSRHNLLLILSTKIRDTVDGFLLGCFFGLVVLLEILDLFLALAQTKSEGFYIIIFLLEAISDIYGLIT